MKKVALMLGFVAASVYALHVYDLHRSHNRRMDLAQNSFETGCYEEAKNICYQVDDDLERGGCFESAFQNCPKMALKFREWLEKGK